MERACWEHHRSESPVTMRGIGEPRPNCWGGVGYPSQGKLVFWNPFLIYWNHVNLHFWLCSLFNPEWFKFGAGSLRSNVLLLICVFQMFLRAMLLSCHILWEYFVLVLFVCLHAPNHWVNFLNNRWGWLYNVINVCHPTRIWNYVCTKHKLHKKYFYIYW